MKLIGQILVDKHGLSPDVLAEALKLQEEKGGRIGEILIRQKAITGRSPEGPRGAIRDGIHPVHPC